MTLRGAAAIALLSAGLVWGGCGGGGSPSQCTVGASVACACTDGRTGAQVCKADHTLSACTCTGGGTAGASGSSGTGGGSGTGGASGTAGATGNGGAAGSAGAAGVGGAGTAGAAAGGGAGGGGGSGGGAGGGGRGGAAGTSAAGSGGAGGRGGAGGAPGLFCPPVSCAPNQICCNTTNNTWYCANGTACTGTGDLTIECDGHVQCGVGLKCCARAGINGQLIASTCILDQANCPTNYQFTICNSSADCPNSVTCCQNSTSYEWRFCGSVSTFDCN